jgi:hypothetical protein
MESIRSTTIDDDDDDDDGEDVDDDDDDDYEKEVDGPMDNIDDGDVASSYDAPPPPSASASSFSRKNELESDHVDGGGGSINITMFESMYHLAPSTVWRLRSAHSPCTLQESHRDVLGSEILAHRHPGKADAMMRGIEVTRESEAWVCEKLRKIGDAMRSVERLRGLRIRRARGVDGTMFGGRGMRDGAGMSTYSSREGDDVDNGDRRYDRNPRHKNLVATRI